MQVGIIGAGAIGGWIAARLAHGGHDVRILARAETGKALRADGLALVQDGERMVLHPRICADAQEVGLCDLVIVGVKSFALESVAPSIAAMMKPETLVVPMLNGVPWWFMGRDVSLRSVDPHGILQKFLPYEQIVACVVHAAAARTSPAEITLFRGDRLIMGEPGGGAGTRVSALVDQFRAAGLPAEQSHDVRADIWFKLWGNMTINPISALTLATADRILDDPLVLGLIAAVMEEAREIGRRIGCPIEQSTVERNAVTRKLGAFRTSMLQDVDASRPIELDALLAAPREIAAMVGVATPSLDILFGLTRLMGVSRGIYG